MATGGCIHCLRWFVFILNLLFWLAGLGVFGVAIWLLVDSDFANSVAAKSGFSDYYIGVYILLAVGIVMTLFGFLGCCGALKQSQVLLASFFVLLLLVFIAELVCGILMYYYQDNIKGYVKDSMRDAIQTHYGVEPGYTEAIDKVQQSFQCCGAASYRNWLVSNHVTGSRVAHAGTPNIEAFSNTMGFVPKSCCTPKGIQAYADQCGVAFPAGLPPSEFVRMDQPADSFVYTKGCNQALIDYYYDKVNVIIGLAVGIGCFQLLGMVLTMFLCCWYNKEESDSKIDSRYE